MRLAITAAALSISLFSASTANAQSVTYILTPAGPSVVSFGGQLSHQDIRNFENDLNFCEKLRYDTGIPRMSPAVNAAMQTCMNDRLKSGPHEPTPKWRETADMAAQLCVAYISNRSYAGPAIYRRYATIADVPNCIAEELRRKR